MDLVKYTILILNVHANDLLKYLAVNGRIRASSVDGLGMCQFLVGPSMAGIEKVVTVSYIKEFVEKQAKTHREVSEILRQRYPGVEGLFERSVRRYCATYVRHDSGLTSVDLDNVATSAIAKVRASIYHLISKYYRNNGQLLK